MAGPDGWITMAVPRGEERLRALAELMFKLFVNRADDYAIQTERGYVRANSEAGQRLRAKLGLQERLSAELIERHLKGEVTLGVYPFEPERGLGKWGCFDFDDAHPDAVRRLYEAICRDEALKSACLVEQSSTPERIHVWLFFDEEKLDIIRWIMKKIAERAGIGPKEVEIFPKQKDLSADFGNLVRLPLGLHRAKKVWSKFIDPSSGRELDALEALRGIRPAVVAGDVRREIEEAVRREATETPSGGEQPPGEWRPPEGLDLSFIEEVIERGQADLIFCPALVKAITGRWSPPGRRSVLSLIHATLRGLGFNDRLKLKGILARINERFDPPLGGGTFDAWFEAEWDRYGREFSPPGCEIVREGGEALFARLGELELCKGCNVPGWVKHPVGYTAWRVKCLTFERIKLAELTAKHIGKALEAHALIGGVTASYRIPIGIEVKAVEPVLGDEKGILTEGIKVGFDPTEQAEFVGLWKRRQKRRAIEMALMKACPDLVEGLSEGALKKLLRKLKVRIRWGTAVEAHAMDVVDELRADEKSITPRGVKVMILREPPLQSGRSYILRGTAGAIPPHSEIVFIATELEEERGEGDIDLEAVREFCRLGPAREKVELLERVCGGIERFDMFMAIALTYFSPLYIPLRGHSRLGTLTTEIFGDTRAFKSEGVKRACRVLGGALYVSLETGGRTGLLYTVMPLKAGRGYTIVWGEMITADRKLIVIDGANALEGDEWKEFRESRSDGCVKVRRAAKGDAWCRARTILIRNPEGGRPLADFLFKVDALSTYQPPDVARLDIIVPVEAREEERTEKIAKQELASEETLKRYERAFREARKLIWSLPPERIDFTPEAIKAIEEIGMRLVGEFCSKNYPIVSADVHIKLAKLSAAFAALDGSLGEGLDRLIVEEKHVRQVAEWWAGVLRAAGLHHYARIEREHRVLPPEELKQIVEEIEADDFAREIFEFIATGKLVKRSELAAFLGVHEQTISKSVKLLKKHRLIYTTSRGYKFSPRGVQVAKAMFFEEDQLYDVRMALNGGGAIQMIGHGHRSSSDIIDSSSSSNSRPERPPTFPGTTQMGGGFSQRESEELLKPVMPHEAPSPIKGGEGWLSTHQAILGISEASQRIIRCLDVFQEASKAICQRVDRTVKVLYFYTAAFAELKRFLIPAGLDAVLELLKDIAGRLSRACGELYGLGKPLGAEPEERERISSCPENGTGRKGLGRTHVTPHEGDDNAGRSQANGPTDPELRSTYAKITNFIKKAIVEEDVLKAMECLMAARALYRDQIEALENRGGEGGRRS